MTITKRQMACFTNNKDFAEEVKAALLPVAVDLTKKATVILANSASSEAKRRVANMMIAVAAQVLNEQSINAGITAGTGISVTTQLGTVSTAIQSLILQLLRRAEWTLTPEQWVADETAAYAFIETQLTALMHSWFDLTGYETTEVSA